MNIRLILAFSVTTVLGGCASHPPFAESGATIRSDATYMEIVEQAAQRRGVVLHWVNPPKTDQTPDAPPRA